MKIKHYPLLVTGAILLVSSFQSAAQDLSREEKIRLLEEKRQEIDRLEQDNELLKEQVSAHEVTIADYRARIEALDQKIQEQKQPAGESEDST